MKYIKWLSITLVLCMCSFKVVNASDSSFSEGSTTTSDSTSSIESSTTSENLLTSESQTDYTEDIDSSDVREETNSISSGDFLERSTLPTDTFKPDKKAIQFIFPIRLGFISQPQPVQYLVKGQEINLDFKNLSWGARLLDGSKIKSKLYRWEMLEDGSWTKREVFMNKSSDGSFLGLGYRYPSGIRLNTSVPASGVDQHKAGVYYYQVESRLVTFPLLGTRATYYSNLARVEIYDKAIPTEKLTIKAPQVIFNNAIYPVSAVTDPINSTTEIKWSSNNSKLGFLAEEGRHNEIEIQNMVDDVNTDVNKPGIPFTITATAKDFSNTTKSATETIYLGGLAAKVQAPTDNFRWKLDQQGLIDLDDAIETEYSWNYEWKFYDYKGNELKNVSDNIDNLTGTVTNLSDLNSLEKAIYIKNNSSLMKKAYEYSEKGQDISTQVILTTKVVKDPDKGTTENVTISSNKASLTVRKPPEELTIKQVPDFTFDSIPVSYIYEGIGNNIVRSAENDIKIVDTRENSRGWILSASMDRFKTSSGTQLTSTSSIKIKGTGSDKTISDDNSWIPIMQSNTSETVSVTGTLGLSPNPTINLQEGDMFSSTITWNLISANLRAGSL